MDAKDFRRLPDGDNFALAVRLPTLRPFKPVTVESGARTGDLARLHGNAQPAVRVVRVRS